MKATRARVGQTSDLFGRGMLYVLIWSMQMIVATVVSPVLTRIFGPSGFGALSAAIALFQLLIVITVLGLDQALVVQRVEDEDATLARNLIAAGIGIELTVVIVAAFTAPWWAPVLGFASLPLVWLTLGWVAPGAAVMLLLSLLQAEDRLARFATVSLFSTVGGQVLGLVLVFVWERTPEVYALGGVIGQGIAVVLGLIWATPRPAGLFDLATLRRGLRLGIPLALTALSAFLLTAGDRFIIQRLLGEEEVARYQVAFTVGNVVALILTFTNRAWLPRLGRVVDEQERWRVIASSRDGLFQLVAWAVIGITVAAPPLLALFAPASYRQESLVTVVALVGLAAFPVAAAAASSQMLVTIRWSVPLAWASASAVVVKIVLTFVLIGPLGIDGAALATLAGLFTQALVLRFAVLGRYPRVPTRPGVWLLIAATVLLCGASVLAPQTVAWQIGRFVLACGCLVPFAGALIRLQRAGDPDPSPSTTAASPRRAR